MAGSKVRHTLNQIREKILILFFKFFKNIFRSSQMNDYEDEDEDENDNEEDE